MRMITGYLHPTAGSIMVDGVSVHEQGQRVRSKIGYLPETPPLYPDMTVQSYLRFVANLRDVPAREVKLRVSEMVSRLGLQGREKQLVRGLSKGYKQRLGLAGAIIHKPDLLVLDEPTSGLDPNQIIEIRDLIRELGENHTVLLSTHILPEVSTLCNRMLIINQGQLVLDGSPQHFGSAMGDQFKVSIEVKATAEQLHNVLTPWEKVRSEVIQTSDANTAKDTSPTSASVDTVKMLLTGESAEDFREELFYLLSGAGLPILEMKKENLSLEQIFLKLTTTEATDTDANLADVDKVAETDQDVTSDIDSSSISETSASTSADTSPHSRKGEDSK